MDDDFDWNDKRPIGEIFGLRDNDPWATPEELEESRKQKEHENKHRKKKDQNITDESFDPDFGKGQVNVRKVTLDEDDDGVFVDSAIATKGFWEDKKEEVAVERIWRIGTREDITADLTSVLGIEVPETVLLSSEYFRFRYIVRKAPTAHLIAGFLTLDGVEHEVVVLDGDTNDTGETFVLDYDASQIFSEEGAIGYKVRRQGTSLREIMTAMTEEIKEEAQIMRRGQTPDHTWFVCKNRYKAAKIRNFLEDADMFACNELGVELKAEYIGTPEVKKEKPRLWNDQASALAAMTPEELEKNKKSIKGDEFIFCGDYHGGKHGSIIYIAPLVYFSKHQKLFDQPLDIERILGSEFKELEPGVYQTYREWAGVIHQLTYRGMIESMTLQLYVNTL